MDPQQLPGSSVPDSYASTAPGRTRRRRTSSLPPAPNHPEESRGPAHQPAKGHQSTSPEVIASLIDSLSAISIPAHNHFENIPPIDGTRSTPVSPHAQRVNFLDLPEQLSEKEFLHPHDAAEPPIVRTSKPPSGLSPLTAPKTPRSPRSPGPSWKRDSGSYKECLRTTQSTTSLHSAYSAYDRDDAVSIGNISIEAGARPSEPSIKSRTSSESTRRSGRGKSLLYMSSRERLKRDSRSFSVPSEVDASVTAAAIEFVTQAHLHSEKNIEFLPGNVIQEESTHAAPLPGTKKKKRKPPPMTLVAASSAIITPDGPLTPGGAVPQRQSSLRHSSSSPRRERRRDRPAEARTLAVPEEEETKPTPSPKGKEKATNEDISALRRIEELKQKAWFREKSSENGAMTGEARLSRGGAEELSTSDLSPISPTSTVASAWEKRHSDSDTKARKILGIYSTERQDTLAPPGVKETIVRAPLYRDAGNDMHAPLTPMTPMGPLPINYNHVLQSLDQIPHSPPSSKDSTNVRRAESKNKGGVSPLSSPDEAYFEGDRGAERQRQTRSSEYDTSEPYKSPFGSRTASISSTGRKGKRWSHPDMPRQEQKRTGKKGASPAVQSPQRPIREDRPASVDSMEQTIEDFVNAPRLSQQVRHPTNGRVISFSEVGDPKGFAVFCCVGMGLTRYVMSFYDELAKTLKLRLITPDRPGIGGSEADENVTPLTWTDDIYTICQALRIPKFSVLAHSAGAVYALATALRMPQHIRGKVHLLAPWIPPSQMAPIGVHQNAAPGGQLPRAQRFLRTLPPSILKIANASFLSTTSASITRSMPKSPAGKTKRKSTGSSAPQAPPRGSMAQTRQESMARMDLIAPNSSALNLTPSSPSADKFEATVEVQKAKDEAAQQRREALDERLTFAIWERATTNANPATDLIVCLETRYPIGFRYEDITRGVVIHHGSKDSRVPVENVRWLGRIMRRCEVRILEGESHGLMANPIVMGNLLMEMSKEWEDWTAAVEHSSRAAKRAS
ncbi:alpha/beta-hydrolase [Pseudovirgaria hyperparasitica]|uniref:Alpha/beta-hydrolase n=1 Tax=Pseudovirgaria hyperparasitica TaxID=470096 RepID=A0A6A6W1E2_9PEZI|nr:alpha/beta-hydrolase [Pseudovirgaria hyperparasitica]KAF2755397.1 alpha/beta-hydrolase [Pseudovirgaria hyperparasitica]